MAQQGAEVDHAGRLYWIQDPRDELCVGEVRGAGVIKLVVVVEIGVGLVV